MSTGTAADQDTSRRALLGPVFVIVLHLAALAVLPANPPLVQVAVLEAASLGICAVSLAGTGNAFRMTVVCWVVALGLFGVIEVAQLGTNSLWLVALTLVIVGLLVGYGLHRYQQVRLGLVSDEA